VTERLKYKKGLIAGKKTGLKQLASLISDLSNNPTLPLRLGSDVICSMSAVGRCADNAAMKGCFGGLNRERVNR
jgi:hypothetical protein